MYCTKLVENLKTVVIHHKYRCAYIQCKGNSVFSTSNMGTPDLPFQNSTLRCSDILKICFNDWEQLKRNLINWFLSPIYFENVSLQCFTHKVRWHTTTSVSKYSNLFLSCQIVYIMIFHHNSMTCQLLFHFCKIQRMLYFRTEVALKWKFTHILL